MAKASKTYKCSSCGNTTITWYGRCPKCQEFSTLEETVSEDAADNLSRSGLKSSKAVKPVTRASTIAELSKRPIQRTPTGITELDRVLGGGFVDAEVVLFGGLPGAGKSTLSLAVAESFAKLGQKVLYSSGEESEQQIGLRAARMGVTDENIKIVNETNLETLLGHIDSEEPNFLIVDSLQTIASSEIPGSIGSITQSKEAAHTLTRLAKNRGLSMLLINQVVKGGDFAGSESLQHIVDASLMLESSTDTPLKFLRAGKNRFGDTSEVGVFQHTETGLQEVTDPSGIFLEVTEDESTGASCSFISEGVRQIPVEIQALVTRSNLPQPRKQFNGVNHQRGQIVCAILDKFCGAKLYENDVFISTVSGVRVIDPQADLSMAASILSSLKDKEISSDTAFVGELSLTGHVRGSFMVENKVKEAARLGFTKIVLPAHAAKKIKKAPSGVTLIPVKSVKELLTIL